MAELEDFFGETIQKRKRTKACEKNKSEPKKMKRQLKGWQKKERPPEEEAHEKKG